MYCDRVGTEEEKNGKKISTRTFTPPGFCSCCSLPLARLSVFPTSLSKNLRKHLPLLILLPLSQGQGWGQDTEENKIKGLLCSPRLVTAPLQGVLTAPTRQWVTQSPCAQYREGLNVC